MPFGQDGQPPDHLCPDDAANSDRTSLGYRWGIGRTNCLVNEPFLGHTPLLATLLASDKEDYVNFRANPSQNPVRGRIVTLNKGKGYGVFVHLF